MDYWILSFSCPLILFWSLSLSSTTSLFHLQHRDHRNTSYSTVHISPHSLFLPEPLQDLNLSCSFQTPLASYHSPIFQLIYELLSITYTPTQFSHPTSNFRVKWPGQCPSPHPLETPQNSIFWKQIQIFRLLPRNLCSSSRVTIPVPESNVRYRAWGRKCGKIELVNTPSGVHLSRLNGTHLVISFLQNRKFSRLRTK